MHEIGGWLKKIRKEHRMTQEQLANLCGWGQPRIWQYENGFRCPKTSTLEKIAHAYGMSYQDFWARFVDDCYPKKINKEGIVTDKLWMHIVATCGDWMNEINDNGASRIIVDFLETLEIYLREKQKEAN